MNDITSELAKLHHLTGAEFSRQVECIARRSEFHLIEGETAIFAAGGESSEDYENLLNGAGLTEVGAYYLRESDRKLEGTISYQIEGEEQPLEATFRMRESDFKRNHSWIVYAYYEGLSGMQVQLVDVTPWEEKDATHTVYNW